MYQYEAQVVCSSLYPSFFFHQRLFVVKLPRLVVRQSHRLLLHYLCLPVVQYMV